MSHRVPVAVLLTAALAASACSSGGPATDAGADQDPPALIGVERNLADGARRVDTTIDPGELEPPLPPRPTIGDLTIPCGPASEAAIPAGIPGITTRSITIGTGNDRGGLYTPGSGAGLPDTIRVLADRCNALGGINGRLIEVVERDAAVVELEAQMHAACADDFALVGHGYLLDAGAESVRVECGLPSFPAWTSSRPAPASRAVAAVPSQPDHMTLDGLALAAFTAGEAGRMAGIVVPGTDGGRAAATRLQAALVAAGLQVETTILEYPVDREPNWDAIAGWAAVAGLGVIWVEGSCGSTLVPLMVSVRARDWNPSVVGGTQLYDPYCASAHPLALDGVVVTSSVYPAEDRESVAAVDEHVQLLRAAGVAPTADALRAASAFWLWASATSRCGEPVTRECVVVAAEQVDEWTAGGLHPATDPGTWTDSGCFVLMTVVAGVFERVGEQGPGEMNCASDLRVEVG